MKQIPEVFYTTPMVFAVGKNYQIIVPVTAETVMWVKVGDENFYDDSNGVLRSRRSAHRMTVPADLLDREQEYTIYYRLIRERKSYFTDASDVMTYTSRFCPVGSDPIHAYQIADAHNSVDRTVAAGTYFGEDLDFLILNGDIPNHSGKIEYFLNIYKIAAELTEGEKPVIFARGNHDTRGIFAEELEAYTPTDEGRSYYTFRVGNLWGVVLDCGEDKDDDHEEYGHTVCCRDFRRRETAFLRKVIENAETEYHAPGVEHRIVICHIPFTQTFPSPFDIETETYTLWARLLRENVKPQVMFCGHKHRCYINEVGGKNDHKGQPCPVVVGSCPRKEGEAYTGSAFTLYPHHCNVKFTNSNGEVEGEQDIPFDAN